MKLRLAVAGALVALTLPTSGCSVSDDSDEPVLPPGRAIGTSRSIVPTTHLFADSVTARLDILLDRRLLDPDRVDLKTSFAPYEEVGAKRFERRDSGPYTRLRYEFTLRCQTIACVPETLDIALGPGGARGERRTFRLAPADVLYDDPEGELPPVLRSVPWPSLTSVSRISVAEVQSEFPFRSSPAILPSPSHRVAPWLLAGGLGLAALASLVWPLTLGVRSWRARRPPPVDSPEPELTPLERALRLVEQASEDDDRRGALEQLAAELGRMDGASLAGEASALAWSRTTPTADDALTLVGRVREDDGPPTRA